ncbi:hypothetical protein AB3N04_05470 [Alkalihalophilus sp. As8PL]|uniref:Lipoprotein n=1 Tax=Alkalihalophilus sp. As8PL TaxID=3237103 RepID=A0AB39BVR7_9BACI
MHKKLLMLLIVIVLLLAACVTDTYTYYGEEDHWSAELKITQTSDEFETQELVLIYEGEDVNSVGEITYYVDSVGGFGRSGIHLEENGTISDSSVANPTNAKVTEHTEVEVTVEWDGQTESFILDKQ